MSSTTTTAAPPTAPVTTRHWVISVVLSTAISLVAVLIGVHKFQVGPAAIALFPIVWAVLIGALVGAQRVKPLSGSTRAAGDLLIRISIVLFLARLGMEIGPALPKMGEVGPAMALQELGHIFGTVILALPVAVALGLGRVSIGAAWSIDRESFLAYAIERFGVRSPEYRGVFSVWLLGSVFGALFISLLAGLLGGLDIFDPRALALGLGLGSSSMMLGGVAALPLLYPEQAGEIMALAALSNLVTNIVGFYAGVYLALPAVRRLYAFWTRVLGRPRAEIEEAHELLTYADVRSGDTALRERSVSGAAGHLPRMRDDDNRADDAAPAVLQDPPPPSSRTAILAAYAITAVVGLLVNTVGMRGFEVRDLAGMAFLLALTAVAFEVVKRFPAIPASVAVLSLATIISMPWLPGHEALLQLVDHLDVILVGISGIALIGMGLGRDIEAFKKLNWKIVVVALITYSSSFVVAAVIAELALGLW